jgi:hypothetical protein
VTRGVAAKWALVIVITIAWVVLLVVLDWPLWGIVFAVAANVAIVLTVRRNQYR